MVYEHCNYQGRSLSSLIGTNYYNVINLTGFNDIISSVKVLSGLIVDVLEHNSGGGSNRRSNRCSSGCERPPKLWDRCHRSYDYGCT